MSHMQFVHRRYLHRVTHEIHVQAAAVVSYPERLVFTCAFVLEDSPIQALFRRVVRSLLPAAGASAASRFCCCSSYLFEVCCTKKRGQEGNTIALALLQLASVQLRKKTLAYLVDVSTLIIISFFLGSLA
jgi:hypothetical protein